LVKTSPSASRLPISHSPAIAVTLVTTIFDKAQRQLCPDFT
jgi:hypothetical protein